MPYTRIGLERRPLLQCPDFGFPRRSLADHSETVEIEYDPKVTSYEELLKIFWTKHDPTIKCSRQYMSAIFYQNEEQKKLANLTMEIEAKKRAKPIATQIIAAREFYHAEDYHQKYLLQKHGKIMNLLEIEPGEELNKSYVATRLNGYLGGYGNLKDFNAEVDQLALPPQLSTLIRNQLTNKKGNGIIC